MRQHVNAPRKAHGIVKHSVKVQPHLSLLFRSFQEESIDDSNGVGLNVLVRPVIANTNSVNENIAYKYFMMALILWI